MPTLESKSPKKYKTSKSFLFGITAVMIIGILVLFALLVSLLMIMPFLLPPAIGIYTLIKQTNFSKLPPLNSQQENYHYMPAPRTIKESLIYFSKLILKIVLFPLYLWSLGIKQIIAWIVFPKLLEQFGAKNGNFEDFSQEERKFHIKSLTVQMPGSVLLHTREYSLNKVDSTNTKHIIYFGGNSVGYENYITKMLMDARELNAKVIGFHHSSFGYSGRIKSDGSMEYVPVTSSNTLVQDGIAQVQRLLAKNVPANKIVLYGHSLGGGIATLVAAYYNKRNIPIKLFNDRSFSSISNVVMGWLLPDSTNYQNYTKMKKVRYFFRTALAYFLQPFIKIILKASDWDLNAGAVFPQIPRQNRDYMVIRHNKEGKFVNDEVIPYSASIHRVPEIKNERKNVQYEKSRHKFFRTTSTENSNNHIEEHANLRDRLKQPATTYFNKFVNGT